MTPKELLAQLAPEQPMNQDEQGGCVWCAGTPPGEPHGYAGRDMADHEKDCPWVKARLMLGDKLPDSRAEQKGGK